ncbi:MAG: DUF1080 domain-containing protein [Kiritimatiellaeota bacterium]|nr:DUF1080 domain-containing protein [Kiritimatiellota bacterium]
MSISTLIGGCLLLCATVASAETIKGRVSDVRENVVKIIVEGDTLPIGGDAVLVYVEIPGLDVGATVAEGKVTEVAEDGSVSAKLEQTSTVPKPGYLVRITSAKPQKRTASTVPPEKVATPSAMIPATTSQPQSTPSTVAAPASPVVVAQPVETNRNEQPGVSVVIPTVTVPISMTRAEIARSEVPPSTPQETPIAPARVERPSLVLPAGFQPLFNGKDLDGWRSAGRDKPNWWKAEDGKLVNLGAGDDLVTEQKFDDFEFHCEYNLPAGANSGVFLRGRYEVQLLDDAGKPAGSQSSGGIWNLMAPSENASLPAGEWQTLDVTLIGKMVTVALNGKKVLDGRELNATTSGALDGDPNQPGPILLQGAFSGVSFRNLCIKPLGSSLTRRETTATVPVPKPFVVPTVPPVPLSPTIRPAQGPGFEVSEIRTQGAEWQGLSCQKFSLDCVVRGLRNAPCRIVIAIKREGGDDLLDVDGYNVVNAGRVGSAMSIKPGHDMANFKNLTVLLPNRQLHLASSGEHRLEARISLWLQEDAGSYAFVAESPMHARFSITRQPDPPQCVEVTNVEFEHGAVQDGVRGMRLRVAAAVKGLPHTRFQLYAFLNRAGPPPQKILDGRSGMFRTPEGQACMSAAVQTDNTPSYFTKANPLVFFLPYSELPRVGEKTEAAWIFQAFSGSGPGAVPIPTLSGLQGGFNIGP